MLAALLKKDDKDKDKPSDSLSFGSRSLAGSGSDSLLDRNADLFKRIHTVYRERDSKQRIGAY